MQNGGGGGKLERVSFLAKNGDYCGESAVTYAKVCTLDSPCKAPFLVQKSFREQLAPESLQSPDSISTILESKSSNESHKSNREQTSLDSSFSPSLRDTAPAVARQSINLSAQAESSFKKVDSIDCRAGKNACNDKKSAISENLDSRQMQSVRAYACGLKMGCCDCALGFLRFAGVNAIYFYIAQGISSSLLFPILRHFPPLAWWVKLPLAFGINLGLCVVFVWILIALFWAISHLVRTRTLDKCKP